MFWLSYAGLHLRTQFLLLLALELVPLGQLFQSLPPPLLAVRPGSRRGQRLHFANALQIPAEGNHTPSQLSGGSGVRGAKPVACR